MGRGNTKKYREWKNLVLEKNGYKCEVCQKKENLACHHILPWESYENERFNPANGKVLCRPCHLRLERKLNPLRYWKGKRFTEEHIKKLKFSHLGKRSSPSTEFKKGEASWNKGLKMSQETRKKMSLSRKGKIFSKERKYNMSLAQKRRYQGKKDGNTDIG